MLGHQEGAEKSSHSITTWGFAGGGFREKGLGVGPPPGRRAGLSRAVLQRAFAISDVCDQ